jgi:hypothetical protein
MYEVTHLRETQDELFNVLAAKTKLPKEGFILSHFWERLNNETTGENIFNEAGKIVVTHAEWPPATIVRSEWGVNKTDEEVVNLRKRWYCVLAFNLHTIPGCCGIAMSYHAKVHPRWQKLGLGKIALAFRRCWQEKQATGCFWPSPERITPLK